MKSITLNLPTGLASEFAKEMVELCKKYEVEVDGLKTLLPVTERIKTFEDAVAELGATHPLVIQYKEIFDNFLYEGGQGVSDIVAYLKLRIIVAAINEGWEPQFTTDEYRYYPWFVLYTQEEIDEMDEEQKSRVLGRSGYYATAGVAYSHTHHASSYSYANNGARLCFKERALAEYAGKQFLKEWSDFMGFTK